MNASKKHNCKKPELTCPWLCMPQKKKKDARRKEKKRRVKVKIKTLKKNWKERGWEETLRMTEGKPEQDCKTKAKIKTLK